MKSVHARLEFEADESRHFCLPADGSPSMIYVFTPDSKLGARAYSPTGQDFVPGSVQSRVRLDFWADAEWTQAVQLGAHFTIWYGGDVGHGIIEEVL